MTCLLGKVSMRHLKVRILFAKHKKNLHLSHSWVGFALSKSQESVHGEPGGWHSCWDCISRPAQALVWTGWELPSAIVTIKPDQYRCLFIKDPTWFWSWKGLGMSTLTDLIVNILYLWIHLSVFPLEVVISLTCPLLVLTTIYQHSVTSRKSHFLKQDARPAAYCFGRLTWGSFRLPQFGVPVY